MAYGERAPDLAINKTKGDTLASCLPERRVFTMTTLRGQCHCGNIEVVLTTALSPEQLRLRACTCSFCRRHRARIISDPAGQLEIVVHSDRNLSRYRFGLKTADFLLCRECGVYVGAAISIESR